jgi:DNA repair protein SbcD/Mre11
MPYSFAHLADVHLGAFRQPELRERNLRAFEEAMDYCIQSDLDFVIIAGDLFHTPLPEMRVVNRAVKKMREFTDSGRRIYVVYGSHDYSPVEASIIDVLASAGILTKAVFGEYENEKLKLGFVEDEKTGVKIAGMSARRGGLELEAFKDLDLAPLEEEKGKKVFVFHSAIERYKPDYLKGVAGVPLSLLPKGFDYYASGHVHERRVEKERGGTLVYPGPLWASDFRDLEELSKHKTGFYVFREGGEPEFVEVDAGSIKSYGFDASGFSPERLEEGLKALPKKECDVSLVKVSGEMKGNPGEVDWGAVKAFFPSETVYVNKNSLERESVERVRVKARERGEIEKELFTQAFGEPSKAMRLLKALKTEQMPGERKADFEARVCSEAEAALE